MMLAYHEPYNSLNKQFTNKSLEGKMSKDRRGSAQAERVRKALTKVTDLILSGASIKKIEAAYKEAVAAGVTEEEYAEAVWNARRIQQGMTP